MCTVCLLGGVCPGGCLPGGSAQGEYLPKGGCLADTPLCGQNDRRLWKHYLATTTLRTVISASSLWQRTWMTVDHLLYLHNFTTSSVKSLPLDRWPVATWFHLRDSTGHLSSKPGTAKGYGGGITLWLCYTASFPAINTFVILKISSNDLWWYLLPAIWRL